MSEKKPTTKKAKPPAPVFDVCPRCGKEMTTKKVAIFGKNSRKVKTAMMELIRGGITDPCDLCNILALNHAALNSQKVRHFQGDVEYTPIPFPVKCAICSNLIDVVPCVACSLCREKYIVKEDK